MKTGTPPRIDGRSLDYTKMEVQEGDEEISSFSYKDIPKPAKQRCCWITHTNKEVHEILKTGFDQSPMFTGRIQGLGPRYCPSVEDKINRFAEKESHQLFIEPEGWDTVEIYVNGFSTSLPEEVQHKALRAVAGFKHMKMFRPGYAIEYDYFPPTQLSNTLETKLVKGLFFAGQINGTTGYEEAACQGLIAGINAHHSARDIEPLVLKRNDAYIGVLIDDLINKGTEEPYRMFTSRAEYRILLRQDNADLRLTEIGHSIGLADDDRLTQLRLKQEAIKTISAFVKNYSVAPEDMNTLLRDLGSAEMRQKMKLDKVLARPHVGLHILAKAVPDLQTLLSKYPKEVIESAEIELKYEGYIEKELETAQKMSRLEDISLDSTYDYSVLKSLSIEARQKLAKIKPTSLGQAQRISGVSPADIAVLMVHMGR